MELDRIGDRKEHPPKRHHFIPQMMLRHFTDAEGRLWFWRREFEKGDIRFTSTQNLFVQKDSPSWRSKS